MPQKFKRKLIKYLPLGKKGLLLGAICLFVFVFFRSSLVFYQFAKRNAISSKVLWSLISDAPPPLKNYQGRTNILLLGIGGGKHDGADLTDTIIFLSVDYTKKDLLMISIPRDIWIPELQDKINSAYHYGEEKKTGGGLVLAKATTEEVVGLPIHYSWLVDFSGFKKLIDLVNGVDIFIEKGFVDKRYPIEGKENDVCGGDVNFNCRYEVLQFEPGWQHLDGERALKYVRSREAEGDEGTDFARAKRQQQIILALKDKLLEYPYLKNPQKVFELISAFNNAVVTDMNWSEKILFAKFLAFLPGGNIRRLVLDDRFLDNPPTWQYDDKWVLVPKSKDFKEIQEYINCYAKDAACSFEFKKDSP